DAEKFIISGNYKIINPDEFDFGNFTNTWKDKNLPITQYDLVVKKELKRLRENKIIEPPFSVAVDLIKKIKLKNPSILEIGCSSGYYNEVFKLSGLEVQYEGCDYSEEFIKLAKNLYPKINFKVSDALNLDYADKSFDVVFSSSVILHIKDYKQAIKEAIRVSKNYIIFHRSPIIHLNNTIYTIKKGYGIDMMEVFLNEEEFIDILNNNGVKILSINTHGQFSVDGLNEPVFMKSYLCIK
ncbi:hypothetical protein COV23_00130, partial [Candidatus Wolfebacteria bacterium CG10_big_fil_rev_8_21_14_0_10_31_9]